VVKDDYFSQQLKNVLAKRVESCVSSAAVQKSEIEDFCTVIPPAQHLVYILLAPTSHISLDSLRLLLARHIPFYTTWATLNPSPPPIHALQAPLYAPSTAAHAIEQSTTLWPTTYNPNTSYGPNPAIVTQAQEELERNGEVDVYMALAKQAGMQVAETKMGLPVGVVVVERIAGHGRVVAVAGDARWAGCGKDSEKGNPAGHAVLRAIDFVAQKRRTIAAANAGCIDSDKRTEASPAIHALPAPIICKSPDRDTIETDYTIAGNYAAQVQHTTLSSLEEHYLSVQSNPGSLSPNGYLCLNLEVYLTHEPCIMCSMALVHSRVGRVIFSGSAGPGLATGALRAEAVGDGIKLEQDGDYGETKEAGQDLLKYGLFWREDLNWRFNAWEWRPYMNVVTERVGAGEDGGAGYVLGKSGMKLANDVQI